MLGHDLRGKRLGIVGLGAIGALVARRGRAFGMDIAYHSRNEAPTALVAELEAERLPLDELLASADVVSLHCPLTPSTRHLIGARELALMKPTATLVNTARGAIVDEASSERRPARGSHRRRPASTSTSTKPAVDPGLLELENVVLVPAPRLGDGRDPGRDGRARRPQRDRRIPRRAARDPVPLPSID